MILVTGATGFLGHNQASDIISRLAGKSTWRLNVPEGLMVTAARVQEILAHLVKREPWYPLNLYPYIFYDWPVSSERARRELGFQPTPFEDGARQTLEWYQARRTLVNKFDRSRS